ncbi:MAG: flagellin [Methanofollis liminatans]|nr:flagellin [Methanofollis liminatans]
MRKFGKSDEAFTGLEAAIVLIAFVVVAAVFSYVMLGAGFFTSQKSQEVVHTSVAQTSSSMDVAGTVVAVGDASDVLEKVIFTLQLTAGGSPADINTTTYAVITSTESDILPYNDAKIAYSWLKRQDGDTDWLLENGEMLQVTMTVSSYSIGPNDKFTIDVKPSVGAALPIVRHAPPGIEEDEYYELN